MNSEREKMVAGEPYAPMDDALIAARRRARTLTQSFNATAPSDTEHRAMLLRELLGRKGKGLIIEPPFFCDYGDNISFGENCFLNFNCVILDVAPVTIGARVMFGPAVQIYTATHPLEAAQRASGTEFAKRIIVEDDVWIGGGAILCPGVRVGARSVIGAGAVVTRDVPPDVVAVGNPARVVRQITQ